MGAKEELRMAKKHRNFLRRERTRQRKAHAKERQELEKSEKPTVLAVTESIFKSVPSYATVYLSLAAVAMAEPEAEAGYYGYNPGFYGYNPGFYGYYGHQQQWPSVRAPGFSSTCFGCRGKRSAEAEADAEPGYYGYPYGFHGYPYGLHGYPYLGYRGIATSF